MEVKKPARQIVLETINEAPNTVTREMLCDKLNMKPAGLASVFTQLRLMGHYPMTNSDGTLYMGTEEAYRASRAAKPKITKSVTEQREALMRAKENCEAKMEKYEMADLESREFLVFKLEEARLAIIEYDLAKLEGETGETGETDDERPAYAESDEEI